MDFSEDVFLHRLAPTSPDPFLIKVERAEGIYLYSPDGKRYIDMISGIAVSSLGHRHPRVIQAIQQQLNKHLHVMVYGEYIQSASNRLAQKLTSLLPASLNCCYLVNSGTEANEAALKLAKRATGRTEIISFRKSYHGSTHGSLSVSGNEVKKSAFRPLLPDVRFLDFNEPDQLDLITTRTACVIAETIQGDAGVRIPSYDYMQALRQRCTEVGALLILDEIQCGLGRTGKWFAFQHFNIVPDILTLAKSFGGGLPIGTFVSSEERMQLLARDPMLGHITTFGGNPVCAAAAWATLCALEEEKRIDHVEEKGQLIESLLRHADIREIRRKGLLFAIDFNSGDRVNRIVQRGKELGVITYWFLSHPHSFRIAPPLTITTAEIQETCGLILQAIRETA
ncbi:MAG: aspartate aminotransferase family protein [Cyclobacteriaceae bacterium]|jgi:acetylornithine/succinyldiaminopimelate/putrescine aminotransferase|nr:aspartate aminotransferase family protein [Flammeovirgaceae bacterium]